MESTGCCRFMDSFAERDLNATHGGGFGTYHAKGSGAS